VATTAAAGDLLSPASQACTTMCGGGAATFKPTRSREGDASYTADRRIDSMSDS
jgi:hypothetical protein